MSRFRIFGICFAIVVCMTFLKVFVADEYDKESSIRTNLKKIVSHTYKWVKNQRDNRTKQCSTKPFDDVLLVLVYNSPYYQNNPYLREMYNGVFSKVVFCGPVNKMKDSNETVHIVVKHDRGYFGYHCAAEAMKMYPGYQGYMYGNDDMIINWWNLVDRDRTKIWQGPKKVNAIQKVGEKVISSWSWWSTKMGISACRNFFQELRIQSETLDSFKNFLNISLSNGNGTHRCVVSWSDFFYMPSRFVKDFVALSEIAFKNHLFLEISVHTIASLLENRKNWEKINGEYRPGLGSIPTKFWRFYHHNITFIHPFKMKVGKSQYNIDMLKTKVIQHTKRLLQKFSRCEMLETKMIQHTKT